MSTVEQLDYYGAEGYEARGLPITARLAQTFNGQQASLEAALLESSYASLDFPDGSDDSLADLIRKLRDCLGDVACALARAAARTFRHLSQLLVQLLRDRSWLRHGLAPSSVADGRSVEASSAAVEGVAADGAGPGGAR